MTQKIKIRDSLYILKDSEGNYIFISTSTRRIKKFQVDSLVRDTLEMLDLEKDEECLKGELSLRYNPLDVQDCLQALEREGIVRKYDSNTKIPQRHLKQVLFLDELTSSQEETLELQRKIENSKVAVFGVGGIGTWIVNGLSQIGVGEIRITDPDIIDETNLNRQLFFDSRDIGKFKVDVIKEKLREVNIVAFKKRVEPQQDLEEIVGGCNFLVNWWAQLLCLE